MKAVIIGVIAVVVIGGGGYAVLHKNSDNTSKKNDSSASQADTSNNSAQSSSSTSGSNKPVTATITYSDNGFSPKTVTVKAGDTVVIKNASSQDIQFDSDPHPAHTDDEELNVGVVAPNQSVTFTVKQTGNHGYHNHLNPSDTGTIIVQ